MMMIADEQQAISARRVMQEYQARLAALDAKQYDDPLEWECERARLANHLANIQRLLALWEAGIREPIPGIISATPPYTHEEFNAASGEQEAAMERQIAIEYKRAEIANIDRQIGIQEARIADWRRHRAWVEGEIAALEQGARLPQHSLPNSASRSAP